MGRRCRGADKAIEKRKIIAEAQNFTRTLANEPSNLLTPIILAERAREMARNAGLQFEALDENRMRELKMGSLLSVSQGSAEPPRLIVMTYNPPNAVPNAAGAGARRQGRDI